MIYIKDKKIESLESRIENAKKNMDKLTSAYLYENGNKIIYELDVAKRQLRTFKDNIYKMEDDCRIKLRDMYQNTIRKNSIQIESSKRSFLDFKTDISTKIKADILQEQQKIEKMIKQKAFQYQQIDKEKIRKNREAPETKGYDPDKYWEAIDKAKEAQSDAIKELADLSEQMRRNDDSLKMENVKIREKMQQKINTMKKQLTENQSLWQQLAEAEKRENIMKQELVFTQQCLTKSEKANELLKDELKKVEAERLRLNKYKSNTTARLQDLEGKVKSLGVLGSIDLDKLMDMILSKKRKEVSSIPPITRSRKLQRTPIKPDLNMSFNPTKHPPSGLETVKMSKLRMENPDLNVSNLSSSHQKGTPLSTKRSSSKSNRLQFFKGGTVPEKPNFSTRKGL